MSTLTINEAKALNACLNYPTREDQLEDNFSNGGPQEFRDLLGWNNEQVAALIGSLQAKGSGMMDDEGHDIFWITEDGVNAIFDYIEEHGSPTPKDAEVVIDGYKCSITNVNGSSSCMITDDSRDASAPLESLLSDDALIDDLDNQHFVNHATTLRIREWAMAQNYRIQS